MNIKIGVMRSVDGRTVHTLPIDTFGVPLFDHQATPACHCGPTQDSQTDIWIHSVIGKATPEVQ